MEPVAFVISHNSQRRFSHSAMPDAPVVDDGRSPEALAKRRQRLQSLKAQSLRQSMARSLRWAADRVEPDCVTA